MDGPPNRRSILVVEDDPDIRETLQHLLESSGYAASTASNGREALDVLEANEPRPCLILLDLMMPVMDGWAFLGALDRDDALANIPIVIVSAYTDRATPELAQHVLRKPVDIHALLKVVREHCGPPAQS